MGFIRVSAQGTEDFMATEVAYAKHYRLSQLRLNRAAASGSMLPRRSKDKPTRKQEPVFRHNPLHDMESIWWLCIWIILRLVPDGEDASVWQKAHYNVFKSQEARRLFLDDMEDFDEHTSHLSVLRSLTESMADWQIVVNRSYCESYGEYDDLPNPPKTIRINMPTIRTYYDHGRGFLKNMLKASSLLSFTFEWVSRALNRKAVVKRSRTKTKPQHAGFPAPQAGSSMSQAGPSRAGGAPKRRLELDGVIIPVPKKRRYVNETFLPRGKNLTTRANSTDKSRSLNSN